MDFFDKRVLSVLRDERSRDFPQLLKEVDFSHNTLRLHLRLLVDQGLIVKEKTPSKGLGRPRFTYSLPSRLGRKRFFAISEPFAVVSIAFSRLKHLCRFEKGGYCKKVRKRCEAQNCPQILKNE